MMKVSDMGFFSAHTTRGPRFLALAFAACALAAALAVAIPWARGRPHHQPMADTLDGACDAARGLGWEVQRPFQDPDGPAAVLIDRNKSPSASTVRPVGQPGLVYVVETASPEEAQSSLRPCTHWGRLRLFGDAEMIEHLLTRGPPIP
jgi:hypothetical protein